MFMSTESDELCKGALDNEELFVIESSKTGAQLRDNPETHSSPSPALKAHPSLLQLGCPLTPAMS